MQKSFLLGVREKVLKSPPPKTYGANRFGPWSHQKSEHRIPCRLKYFSQTGNAGRLRRPETLKQRHHLPSMFFSLIHLKRVNCLV